MFVNDIFKKKLNETVLNPRDPQGDYDAKRKVIHDLSLDPAVDQQAVQQRRLDLDKEAKAKGLKEQDVKEGGPFSSTEPKKPRKGSVADLAAQKRREQEKGRQPIEPKDQRVGVARVTKDVAEGVTSPEIKQAYNAIMKTAPKSPERQRAIKHYQQLRADALDKKKEQGVAEGLNEFAPSSGGGGRWYSDDQLYEIIGEDWLEAFDVSGDQGNIDLRGERARLFLAQEAEAWLTDRGYRVNVLDVKDDGDELSWYIQGPLYRGLAEGSAQEKLYKRHQELRRKSGLPDPDYYKELKTTYDLPDDERHAKQKEIKQKYKVTNEDREQYIEELQRAGYEIVTEKRMTCPECGGAAYSDRMLAEKQDACYHKVKSRYKVWPSAYASGALVRCRKKGAKNWGNKSKK